MTRKAGKPKRPTPDWRRARRAGAEPRLALDMAPGAITLLVEGRNGVWDPIGEAVPDTPDFLHDIEWLRVEALARSGRPAPVEIWLPPEQILVRELTIEQKRPEERRNKAAHHVAATSDLTRADCEIAVSPPREGMPTATCLAILSQTRREAEDYARRWGFTPGHVTARHHRVAFGGAPVFAAPDAMPTRVVRVAGRSMRAGLGALAVAGATSAAVWGVSHLEWPAGPPTLPEISAPLAMAETASRDQVPGALKAPSAIAPRATAQDLSWPLMVLDRALTQTAGVDRPSVPQVTGLIATGRDPATDRMALGPALAPPQNLLRKAGRDALPPATRGSGETRRTDAAIREDLARIRAEGLASQPATDPVVAYVVSIAAQNALPHPLVDEGVPYPYAQLVGMPASDTPQTIAGQPTLLFATVTRALAATGRSPLPAIRPVTEPAPRRDPASGSTPEQGADDSAPAANVAPTDAAPTVSDQAPGAPSAPRPAVSDPVVVEETFPVTRWNKRSLYPLPIPRKIRPGVVVVQPVVENRPAPADFAELARVQPVPKPTRGPVIEEVVTPQERPATPTPVVIAELPVPEVEAASAPPTDQVPDPAPAQPEKIEPQVEETGVGTALALAPVPSTRPKRFIAAPRGPATGLITKKPPTREKAVPRSGPHGASTSKPTVRTVRNAVTQTGLPLDQTSLIGIINVSSGREALLRLPNGRFRRVGKGDVLDGWNVSLIGRDALRLTRAGKNHTLLLVTR